MLLKLLWNTFHILTFCLVDADPHGEQMLPTICLWQTLLCMRILFIVTISQMQFVQCTSLHLQHVTNGASYFNVYHPLYDSKAHRPSMQASYTASRVRPKRKINCAAVQIAATQIAATLTISFPRWRHMSLTSYWGQQRMSLTSYPG